MCAVPSKHGPFKGPSNEGIGRLKEPTALLNVRARWITSPKTSGYAPASDGYGCCADRCSTHRPFGQ
jgi:hypothetical protein